MNTDEELDAQNTRISEEARFLIKGLYEKHKDDPVDIYLILLAAFGVAADLCNVPTDKAVKHFVSTAERVKTLELVKPLEGGTKH